MKKAAIYLIPVALLAIFVFIMEGGYYYLDAKEDKQKISMYIDYVKEDVKCNEWQNAEQNRDKLNKAWEKTIPKIQFHAEMDAIDGIKISLGRLEGAIKARDKGLALTEIGEISEHFSNLTN